MGSKIFFGGGDFRGLPSPLEALRGRVDRFRPYFTGVWRRVQTAVTRHAVPFLRNEKPADRPAPACLSWCDAPCPVSPFSFRENAHYTIRRHEKGIDT